MIDVLDQGAFGTGAGPACRAGPGAQPVGRRAPTQSGTPLPPRSSQSNSINTQHLFFIHKQAPNAVIDTSATRASEVNVGSMQHWRIARLAHACPARDLFYKRGFATISALGKWVADRCFEGSGLAASMVRSCPFLSKDHVYQKVLLPLYRHIHNTHP